MTRQEIEAFIVEQGNPETLILTDADWQKVYDCYQATNRDDDGVFILCINTKVRPATPAADVVDLSAEELWPEPEPEDPAEPEEGAMDGSPNQSPLG